MARSTRCSWAFRKRPRSGPRIPRRSWGPREADRAFSKPPFPERRTRKSDVGRRWCLSGRSSSTEHYHSRPPSRAADRHLDFRGLDVRIFVLPVGVLTDLKRGAPDLADALARPLFYGEDPELHVVRDEHDNEPTTWKIVVESESTCVNEREDSGEIGAGRSRADPPTGGRRRPSVRSRRPPADGARRGRAARGGRARSSSPAVSRLGGFAPARGRR